MCLPHSHVRSHLLTSVQRVLIAVATTLYLGFLPHTIYRALIDFFRKRALPSRVLFELGWLILFWIMHLGKSSHCRPGPNFRLTLSIPAQRVPRV